MLARHVLPVLAAALFVTPLLVMVSGALRPIGELPAAGLVLLPETVSGESFAVLGRLLPLGRYLANSAVVALAAVPVTVLVAAWAGFGIRLLPPRPRRVAVLAALAILLVPATALWIPRFHVYAALGLAGGLGALIAPALMATTPFYVLIYLWAFLGVGDSQLAAARLEGATWWRVWWRIAMPQARMASLAVAVLAFTFHWGNFMDALLYLRGQDSFTLPLGLDTLKLLNPTEFPLLMAGALVFTVPAVAVFLLAQRLFEDPARELRR